MLPPLAVRKHIRRVELFSVLDEACLVALVKLVGSITELPLLHHIRLDLRLLDDTLPIVRKSIRDLVGAMNPIYLRTK